MLHYVMVAVLRDFPVCCTDNGTIWVSWGDRYIPELHQPLSTCLPCWRAL